MEKLPYPFSMIIHTRLYKRGEKRFARLDCQERGFMFFKDSKGPCQTSDQHPTIKRWSTSILAYSNYQEFCHKIANINTNVRGDEGPYKENIQCRDFVPLLSLVYGVGDQSLKEAVYRGLDLTFLRGTKIVCTIFYSRPISVVLETFGGPDTTSNELNIILDMNFGW